MAKINLTRIFETSRALATKPGQELQDFITYVAEAFTQIIAALRNALTLEDNFNCKTLSTTILHNTVQVISTDGKPPRRIQIDCQSTTYVCSGFGWQFNNAGQVTVKALFDGAPMTAVQIGLVIYF